MYILLSIIAQDGNVRVWDVRKPRPASSMRGVHSLNMYYVWEFSHASIFTYAQTVLHVMHDNAYVQYCYFTLYIMNVHVYIAMNTCTMYMYIHVLDTCT